MQQLMTPTADAERVTKTLETQRNERIAAKKANSSESIARQAEEYAASLASSDKNMTSDPFKTVFVGRIV